MVASRRMSRLLWRASEVYLFVQPTDLYSVCSYSQSLGVMMARIVQQFGQWMPAHCVAILLLALKHQVSVTPDNERFKCGKLHTALSRSTPFFIVTGNERKFLQFYSKYIIVIRKCNKYKQKKYKTQLNLKQFSTVKRGNTHN